MDDPNAALPSDPTVDESYTKGSRPVRPRARSSASAETAGRSSRADSAPATQRPTRGRAPGPQTNGEAPASGPQTNGEAPASGPQPRRLTSDSWYRRKLARRLGGVATCLVLTMLISHVALSTAPGQVLDTILMEGTMRSARRYEAFSTLITGIVSVPVMVAAGIVVALVAAARRRPTLAGRALGAVIGANITTQILKDYILTRPNLGVTTGAGNSLPSGHTTVAVTLSLALIVVAPQWFRSPAAWIGWAWTSLMGVSVMMEGWHRPSDVITAALIAGAWALALSPIERRPRHGASIQRAMVWVCLGLLGVAVLATLAAMWGFSMSAASPGSGYGFEHFLQIRPWRSRVLGVAAIAWVSGICGLIIHEVDRLAGE